VAFNFPKINILFLLQCRDFLFFRRRWLCVLPDRWRQKCCKSGWFSGKQWLVFLGFAQAAAIAFAKAGKSPLFVFHHLAKLDSGASPCLKAHAQHGDEPGGEGGGHKYHIAIAFF